MSYRIDYKNKSIGYLIPLEYKYAKGEHAYWKVYCSFCNNYYIIGSNVLVNSSGKCKTCINRRFTYLESKLIAKQWVDGEPKTKLAKTYDCSIKAINSALRLITAG